MQEKAWLDEPDIDRLWSVAARRCGFRIERSPDAYASTDGRGTILIGVPSILDHDDCVAQLVLHEICHALVQGEAAWSQPDWGLDNTSNRDDVAEAACLRLQAHFAGARGLRVAMTPTTEWQAYYRALPADPLTVVGEGTEAAAAVLARAALALAITKGIAMVIDATLGATITLVRQAPGQSAPTPPTRHLFDRALGPAGESCGTCAWRHRGGRGTPVDRCRQEVLPNGQEARVSADGPACDRWEPPVDCLSCGACCREAYHRVNVSRRDPVVEKQPDMIEREGRSWSLRRTGKRCAALEVRIDAAPSTRYACNIYEDRPRTCRDFESGGRHCLVARQRVGLSR